MIKLKFVRPRYLSQTLMRNLVFDVSSAKADEKAELAKLIEWMKKHGAEVVGESGSSIEIDFDTESAERMRTRYAGRRKKMVMPGSPLYGMTCAEVLAWCESHSEQEGMDAFGVSRNTYYTRLRDLRGKLEEHPRFANMRYGF